jgi:polyhydroxyalkanoate synthesis regulator phasin
MSNRLRNILPEKIEDFPIISIGNLEKGKMYGLYRNGYKTNNPLFSRYYVGTYGGRYKNEYFVFRTLYEKQPSSSKWQNISNTQLISDDEMNKMWQIYDLPEEFKENNPSTIFQENKQKNKEINKTNADIVFQSKTGTGGHGPSDNIASFLGVGGKKRKTLKKRKLRKGGSGRKSSIIKSRNYPSHTRTDISISDEQKQLDDMIKKGYISSEHANRNRECLDNKKRKNDEEIDELIKSVFSEEEDYKKKPVKRSKKHTNSLLKLGGHHKCKKSKKRCRH